eukprot:CAMPEP_0119404728 /NCGR_PEP_ID=MMETSP1334-20130426/144043_1 /TAXON_ID=127549 /ORGANISM="Calcidiscus leptoporus, Strain RCC1130" /LENGTH=448 /DNA_ID=CAMNT_0007428699 /DNA_START=160 /DNA_END=1506 /DNA_ORIENTATION=-
MGDMGACIDPVWCAGEARVRAGVIKAVALRADGLWRVPDAAQYFEGPFLSYTGRPAQEMLHVRVHATGSEQFAHHLQLLGQQLQDFQAALALALTLNRTLVLPRMLCTCVYAQWPFRGEGNVNCQPFHMQGLHPRIYECPISYWLNLPKLLGQGLPVREPSFLDHPRAVQAVRNSRLSLLPCVSEAETSSASTPADIICTPRGVPLLRAGASRSEIAHSLQPLHAVRLLHVHLPQSVFGGFDDSAEVAQFARKASTILGSWCCAQHEGGTPESGEKDGTAAPSPFDLDVSQADALGGRSYKLAFRPPLGLAEASDGGGGAPQWVEVPNVNNVFGRAELRRSTPCCSFVGVADSLQMCTAMAQSHERDRRQPVSSVTWHRRDAASKSPWDGLCYGIVDSSWQPIKVKPGQAVTDSARRIGITRIMGLETHDGWVDEVAPTAHGSRSLRL